MDGKVPQGHPAKPREVAFTAGDLAEVRRVTAGWAAQAGLGAGRAADLVIAVNEIATNAIRHGSPAARMVLHASGTAVMAEVCDGGYWQPGAAELSPDGGRPGQAGLGLLLARRACDEVQIRSGPGGTVVVLRIAL